MTNKRTLGAIAALTTVLGFGLTNTHIAEATSAQATPPADRMASAMGDASEAEPVDIRDYAKLGMASWKIHGSGNTVNSGAAIKLSNTVSGSFLAWKHQRLGVDLGWHGKHEPSIKLIAQAGGVIRYGQPIAIWVADQPGKNRPERHLYYNKERFGINIGWHKSAQYEWYLVGDKNGSPVKPGANIIIRNKTAERMHTDSKDQKLRADLVFCARNGGGAWLKWAHDCSKADRARTRVGK
jgi:hypothetical protein